MDFTRALPLAVELMVRINSPEGRAHSEWLNVLTNVLYTYTNVDPFGYRDEIECGFAYMDGEVPRGPGDGRFVLHHRWICYLSETECWDEAYDLAMRSVALADRVRGNWHGSWALYELCRICNALGRLEELADHADHMAELSEGHGQLRRSRADVWIWRGRHAVRHGRRARRLILVPPGHGPARRAREARLDLPTRSPGTMRWAGT